MFLLSMGFLAGLIVGSAVILGWWGYEDDA